MIYFLGAIIVYFLHTLLRLNWWITGILAVFAFFLVRIHRTRHEKALESQRRFFEVSMYLDTLLYAFVKEQKVDLALRDVAQTLPEGNMKELTRQALDYITMTFDKTEVLETALQLIEQEYDCQRIRTVHQFMTHVEYYGGEIEKPINLLLADKNRWEQRIKDNMALRKKQLTDIILSAIASLCICAAILYVPIGGLNISSEWVVQICSLLIILVNDAIVLRAQKYLMVDWVKLQLSEDGMYYEKKMEELKHYDEAREKKRSFILGTLGLLAAVICFIIQNEWMTAIALGISFFLFQQHQIGKHLLKKNLMKEIKYQFPNWLLDLVLLLQSENVQVALLKSKQHVPGVLRRELYRLIEQLELEPESAGPYHGFLEEFQLPEIHSAMGILYSLSIGNSGNADKQITELIEKNLEMLDVAESERLQNSVSGMYVLFLLPVMTASFKLMVDMVLLILRFVAMPAI